MPAASRNWKLTLAYDGSGFSGWQIQPGLRTVQGELADALQRITGERVLPQGSGRTDAGVHALGQVASFSLLAPLPPENLLRALRLTLPEDVRPLSVDPAGVDFHARHSARGKTYEYRILQSGDVSPFEARYIYATGYPLDVAAMQAGAQCVVGEHDFTSFAAVDPDAAERRSGDADAAERTLAATHVRAISCSCWQQDGARLTYRVTGNGFLHHMVRNLVGTFLEIGRGRLAADAMPRILAARSRSAAGPTAPARGLFLVSVDYGDAP